MKKHTTLFFFCACVIGEASLGAGVRVETHARRGAQDYRERSLEVKAALPIKIEWDDPDVPLPFTALWLRGRRTGYDRKTASGPTYTNEGGVGIEIFQKSYAEVHYRNMPALSDDIGAYRVRAWGLVFSGGWKGFYPRQDSTLRPLEKFLDTRLTFVYDNIHHEERVQASTRPVEWATLQEAVLGLEASGTLANATTVRFGGDTHSYDRPLKTLLQQRELFPVRQLNTTNRWDSLAGFSRRSWGAGLDQVLGPHVKISADWRRYSYESIDVARSDSYQGRATLSLGLYFSLNLMYEIFDPLGAPREEYKGGGLSVHF